MNLTRYETVEVVMKELNGCWPSSAAVDRKCEPSLCNTSCLAVQLQSRRVLDARKRVQKHSMECHTSRRTTRSSHLNEPTAEQRSRSTYRSVRGATLYLFTSSVITGSSPWPSCDMSTDVRTWPLPILVTQAAVAAPARFLATYCWLHHDTHDNSRLGEEELLNKVFCFLWTQKVSL